MSVHPNHLRFRVPGEETPLGPTNSSFANHLIQYKYFVPLALIWYYNIFLWPLAFHFFHFFWLIYFCGAFFSFFFFFFSFFFLLNNTFLSCSFAPLHKRERKRKVLTHYKAPIKEEALTSTTPFLSFFQQNHGVTKWITVSINAHTHNFLRNYYQRRGTPTLHSLTIIKPQLKPTKSMHQKARYGLYMH